MSRDRVRSLVALPAQPVSIVRRAARRVADGGAPMIRRLPALALCACLASTSLVGQQAPRFRVKVDAVQVDVSVVRGSRPVAGLTAANFELRDSGVVQQVKAVTLEDVPLHLVL